MVTGTRSAKLQANWEGGQRIRGARREVFRTFFLVPVKPLMNFVGSRILTRNPHRQNSTSWGAGKTQWSFSDRQAPPVRGRTSLESHKRSQMEYQRSTKKIQGICNSTTSVSFKQPRRSTARLRTNGGRKSATKVSQPPNSAEYGGRRTRKELNPPSSKTRSGGREQERTWQSLQ